jgi:hypothetical protein
MHQVIDVSPQDFCQLGHRLFDDTGMHSMLPVGEYLAKNDVADEVVLG